MAGLLRGKVIAITGSSSGIGRATAKACASQGASLLLHNLDAPQAANDMRSLVDELKSSNPEIEYSSFSADITKDGAALQLIERTIEKHGRIDSLVNNAGICAFSPYQDVTRALLERHMEVNFTAAYLLAQKAAQQMEMQGYGGSIVNIASITATQGSSQLTHYSPTKAAILGMSVSLGVAVGSHGIRVNSICPGTIETSMNKKDLDHAGKRAEMASRVPLGRLGKPEDVARAVVFFASDFSEDVTGQSLLVDGGASIAYQ